jgi:hypothetical protein
MKQSETSGDDAFLERVMRYQDGELSGAELDALEAELRRCPERRRMFAETQLRSAQLHERFRLAPLPVSPAFGRAAWRSLPTARRPWLAAAAGLLLGCLSTSMVWAINHRGWTEGLRRILLPLANPGFERQETLPQSHLVPVHGQWSGIDTEILPGGDGRPAPFAGERMIRLGPAPEGKGYFASLMTDVSTGRPVSDKTLQVEVSAYFHASKPGQGEHYLLRAATSTASPSELAASWENSWKEMNPLILTSTAKSIYPTPEEQGWRNITIRVDVPPQARTLLISLGSNTPGPVSGRTDHYMDDVRAAWIIAP